MDGICNLLNRCGLAETGVADDALLEGAAVGTSLAPAYCSFLVSTLEQAVRAAADQTLEQPQQCYRTVFAETWHAGSLATLSDADIANAWRLADYLMLDTPCVVCLEDVIVQRETRSCVPNQLAAIYLLSSHNSIQSRLTEIRQQLLGCSAEWCAVARGLAVPTHPSALRSAALWGQWDLIVQARAAGMEWDKRLCADAATAGNLPLLCLLRRNGCPWDELVVFHACRRGDERMALWALENDAPALHFARSAAHFGCLAVLRWAHAHHVLRREELPDLRAEAVAGNMPAVVAWLDGLDPDTVPSLMAPASVYRRYVFFGP
jgi:hypothetical protein